MPRLSAIVTALLLFIACGRSGPTGRSCAAEPKAPAPAARVITLKEGGARVDWSRKLDLIAFDMLGKDGFFDVYTMKPDGSDVKCLTGDHPDLPGKRHIGQPAWHPSGRHLIFQAEKKKHRRVLLKQWLTPGSGVLNDLWVLDRETNRAHLLREVKDAPAQGTLHPHFSDDGKKLCWAELYKPGSLTKGAELGYWKLMVADFAVADGKPVLRNIRALAPHGDAFYETHGFSPDGKELIYCSNGEAKRRVEAHIYVMDLETKKNRKLTETGWNEHATLSPDGRRMVWITTTDSPNGTEFWIMNKDGTDKRRLTFFSQPGHAQYAGKKVVVADSSWNATGTAFVGYWCSGPGLESVTDEQKIIKVELPAEPPAKSGAEAGRTHLEGDHLR